MISNAQVRAARGLLGWSQQKLSEASRCDLALIQRYEQDADRAEPSEALGRIEAAFDEAGIEFLGEGRPGVRMKGDGGAIATDALNASNDS